jgi:hypothetical protein
MGLAKIFAALCLGLALLTGAQSAYVWSIQRHLKSEYAKAGLPPIAKMDFSTKFKGSLTAQSILPQYKPIDTTAGQRAAINSMGHQIYLQHRAAQNAAPLPPRIPGLRR